MQKGLFRILILPTEFTTLFCTFSQHFGLLGFHWIFRTNFCKSSGGRDYIFFPPPDFQYLFFPCGVQFWGWGKFHGLSLGKLLLGLMPKLWVTLKSRQHQSTHGHNPFAAICAGVSYIQCRPRKSLEITLIPMSKLTQQHCTDQINMPLITLGWTFVNML